MDAKIILFCLLLFAGCKKCYQCEEVTTQNGYPVSTYQIEVCGKDIDWIDGYTKKTTAYRNKDTIIIEVKTKCQN